MDAARAPGPLHCRWHPSTRSLRSLRSCTCCKLVKACKECHDWCGSCDKRVCRDCKIECEWCDGEHACPSTCVNCNVLFSSVADGECDVCMTCIMFQGVCWDGSDVVGICRKCNLIVNTLYMDDHAKRSECDGTASDVDTSSASKARFMWDKTLDDPRARRLLASVFKDELGITCGAASAFMQDSDRDSDTDDGQYSSDSSDSDSSTSDTFDTEAANENGYNNHKPRAGPAEL